MSTSATMSEQAIRAHVGERSFQLGLEYFRAGTIFQARRQGMMLKARCQGSRPEAYRVEAKLGPQGIAVTACSCPVGGGGACKHVAALLLAWCERPGDFVEVEDLDAALERRSKEELIALIKQMLRQQPDLEVLLDTPLPMPGQRAAPASPEIYYRQANVALQRRGYEWGAAGYAAGDLLAIAAIGEGFAQLQDYASAAAVYTGVSRAVLEDYDSFEDEEGELSGVGAECAEGLGRCLAGLQEDRAAREAILRALFALYRFSVAHGGIGLGDEVPALVAEQL